VRWRDRIEHLQSGDDAAFLDLDSLLDFVRGFGVMVSDEERAATHESAKWPNGRPVP